MNRRVVSLILLFALLLTQWVNHHRRDDGCATCGRPPAPHVHLGELLPFGERPQSCRCGARSGEENRGSCTPQASGEETREATVTDSPAPTKGCCEDVLLLSGDSVVTQVEAAPKVENSEGGIDAATSRTWLAVYYSDRIEGTTQPQRGYRSAPLYILNRALLI